MTAPANIHELQADVLKAWRTLQARAALAGYAASIAMADDGSMTLTASRWNLSAHFTNLPDLESWLDRVTGGAA